LKDFNPAYYWVKLRALEKILEELSKEAPLAVFELQRRAGIKTLKTILEYLKELEDAGIVKEIEEGYYTLLVKVEPTQWWEKDKREYTKEDWLKFIEKHKDFFEDFLETNIEGISTFLDDALGTDFNLWTENFIKDLINLREEWMEKIKSLREAYEENMKRREFLLNYFRENKTKEYIKNRYPVDDKTQKKWEKFIEPKLKEKYEDILKLEVLKPFNLTRFEEELFLEFLPSTDGEFLRTVIKSDEKEESKIFFGGNQKESILTLFRKKDLITEVHLYSLIKNDYSLFVFDDVERALIQFNPLTRGAVEKKKKVKELNVKETYRKILIYLIERNKEDEFIKSKIIEFYKGQLNNIFEQIKNGKKHNIGDEVWI